MKNINTAHEVAKVYKFGLDKGITLTRAQVSYLTGLVSKNVQFVLISEYDKQLVGELYKEYLLEADPIVDVEGEDK